MKKNTTVTYLNIVLAALFFIVFTTNAFSQNTKSADTLKPAQPDTLKTTQVEAKTGDEDKGKDKKGKKNEIVLYTGINFTQLSSSSKYESESDLGYQLGAYYKQGRLVYWQVGARLANSKISFKPSNLPNDSTFESLNITDIDLPLTVGLNFTSFMNRVLSARLFVSAVPAFTIKLDGNPYGITKEDLNPFVLYGQGGLGVNVAFMVLELGYNYGFNEVLETNTDSKPGQLFINLGFRF